MNELEFKEELSRLLSQSGSKRPLEGASFETLTNIESTYQSKLPEVFRWYLELCGEEPADLLRAGSLRMASTICDLKEEVQDGIDAKELSSSIPSKGIFFWEYLSDQYFYFLPFERDPIVYKVEIGEEPRPTKYVLSKFLVKAVEGAIIEYGAKT